MYDGDLEEVHRIIFNALNTIEETKLARKECCVLAIMYKLGLGTEQNEGMFRQLLPEGSDWVYNWIKRYNREKD